MDKKNSPAYHTEMLISRMVLNNIVIPNVEGTMNSRNIELKNLFEIMVSNFPLMEIVRELSFQFPGIENAFMASVAPVKSALKSANSAFDGATEAAIKHGQNVAEAVDEHHGLWPAELFTDIMLWKGDRITRKEFEEQTWGAR